MLHNRSSNTKLTKDVKDIQNESNQQKRMIVEVNWFILTTNQSKGLLLPYQFILLHIYFTALLLKLICHLVANITNSLCHVLCSVVHLTACLSSLLCFFANVPLYLWLFFDKFLLYQNRPVRITLTCMFTVT